MNFIKTFFASVLGSLAAFGLLLAFVLIMASGFASLINDTTAIKTISFDECMVKVWVNRLTNHGNIFDHHEIGKQTTTLYFVICA